MINSHSHDMSDLQLEDVEDYTADYPPAGFPQSEENLHTSAVADSPPKYRTAKVVGILRSNKWLAGLMVIVVCIAISIVAIASGGPKEPKGASSAGASSSGSTHQPPITVDPKSLDPRVTNALMNTLLSLYDRHGLDPSVLDDADSDATSAQKKAFFWLATDENLDNMDHTAKAQRFALACFYYATNAVSTPYTNKPQPWVSAHLWLSKSHVCEWRGIVCNEQQHVQAVDLERNNLSGSIPHEMTILASTLIELDLTSNLIYMEDDMFDAFESLDNLEILLMDDNYLGGDSGLPKQFQNMKKLQKLRLSYNLFAGELERDHKVLSNLGKLTHLEIESNFLTGTMPDVIGDMENLVYLYMRRNEMSYNLDFLKSGNLKNLFALWLDNNDITGTIPTEIGLLTEIASVSITNATLTGTIPTEFGQLEGLRRLWLYSNQLTGNIPAELDGLEALEVLEIHHNKIEGAMPSGICSTIEGSEYEYKSLTSDCEKQVECDKNCCTDCF